VGKEVFVILGEGFEESEAVVPMDILRRSGVQLTLVSAESGQRLVRGGSVRVETDVDLRDVAGVPFDALLLPGGPAVQHLRKNGAVLNLIRRADAAKKIIAAICAAPLILKDADVLRDKKYTSYPSTWEELPDAVRDRAVVEDGTLITGTGPGAAAAFGLALASALVGPGIVARVRSGTGW
jgi:4-methyl-5(b-hydroxyethyl)-thiazole monophosphate biosynthesis